MPKESPVSTCLSTFVISYLPYDNHPNKHEVIPQGGFLFFFMFFVWLHRVLVVACRVFVEAHGPCSCGGQAQLCHVETLFPDPAIKPASPALRGGFLSTGPPEKSLAVVLICVSLMLHFLSSTCWPSECRLREHVYSDP